MYNVTYDCNVLCDVLPNEFYFFLYFGQFILILMIHWMKLVWICDIPMRFVLKFVINFFFSLDH